MNRAIFLATAALLAMLILAPMAMSQVPDTRGDTVVRADFCCPTNMTTMADGIPAPNTPPSGGPAILLPAVALLVGYPDLRDP